MADGIDFENSYVFRPAHTLKTKAGEWRIPPGLRKTLPFYLHKPWARLGKPILLFEYMAQHCGPISHYMLFGNHVVFLNDPAAIREVLVNQANKFVRERTITRLKILLGEGLLTSDDPIHKRSRRIVAPAFHRQRIHDYADEMVRSTQHWRSRWHDGDVVDMNAEMMTLSLDIVARTLFATEVDDDIRQINEHSNRIMAIYNFLVGFPNAEAFLKYRIPVPGLRSFAKSRAKLDEVINRIIRERKAANAADPEHTDRHDLLSMLLASRDEDGSELSDEQLRDEVLTIFLAGYETTANALSWTWYLLSTHPEHQETMYAELREVLGDRTATLEDYASLKYTQMVFAEAMRLYPPAWAMGRKSTEPIEVGPYYLPPGTHFFLSQYVLQRDARFYPEPLKFDPLRHTEEEKAKRDKFEYFPFGGGPRQCIGEGFAWLEGVLLLAGIAQKWRMTWIEGQPVAVEEKITLRPKYPLRMTLHAR
ncbi:cytochrome P450 [Terriglobus sp. TAA 43]|uniref:cytochrome P450 n=1 Tax=Terriglobus sp. TAA 43 TaxID=278961 RepID=UPI000648C193|nr:cytochrome P450 [Terriglobus sp. TAA 43]